MTEYENILTEAKENPAILGLILLGSRGKGFENEHSDYDLAMVVKDEAAQAIRDKYKPLSLENIDLNVYSLTDFRAHASLDSDHAWDRYDFAHVQILVDKTSDDTLKTIIKEKGYIPPDKINEFIDYWIDAYVNGAYRSVKCIRNGNTFGAHLEAVNSMLDLQRLVFALEGRHRPFLSYVEKELTQYPLQNLPWPSTDFVAKVEQVLATGDLATQQELLIGIEKVCRATGHGKMFDGWEGKDRWAMTFKPG